MRILYVITSLRTGGAEKLVVQLSEFMKDRGHEIISFAERLTEGDENIPADLRKARMWYEIASQLGVEGAREGLKKVDSMMKSEGAEGEKQTALD